VKYLWLSLGWLSIALGVAGAVLPLLPTTPFLLLAAFSFSKGSDRLHRWLVDHPNLGAPIRDWNEYRVIARTTKVYASLSLLAVLLLSLVMQVPWWAFFAQCLVLAVVATFLWRQKERPTACRSQP
jgi:uncharacterized membrane protein YbaN (DUF454 family)